jgi:hypothetical protein
MMIPYFSTDGSITEGSVDKYTNILSFLPPSSVAWARRRTITTERPPLVGEVSVNFYG